MDKGNNKQDNRSYQRPNQKWECGWACDGKACRIGPSDKGECRATFECRPMLEKAPGEAKGRWRCTRPNDQGGACPQGPTPEGKCCNDIPRCTPRRSLRSKRGILCLMTVVFFVAILLVFGGSTKWRWKFFSPGDLSTAHQSEAFYRMEEAHFGSRNNCAGCHGAARKDNPGWVTHAIKANPSPFNLAKLVTFDHKELTTLDHSCQTCHKEHDFHQPTLTYDYSCMACHQEHRGKGRLAPPADTHCIVCHGNKETMQASAALGKTMPADKFHYQKTSDLVRFASMRPAEGYTQVFKDFSKSHPEFQVHREKLRDPDTLRFNHALHFGKTIPKLNGHELSCADCHKPQASGIGFVRIKFEDNCQSCHSLQFDPRNPELQVPHGNVESVRAYLRSLPRQYADLASRKGLRRAEEQEGFTQSQLQGLKQNYATGELLEKAVFFTSSRKESAKDYIGCAYCHTTGTNSEGIPTVVAPVIPDQWMIHARFNHARHTHVSCTECHAATTSRDTADILLPQKANCINCHSPKGGVSQACTKCHGFHNFPEKK